MRWFLVAFLLTLPLYAETGQETVNRMMAAHVTGPALDRVCHQRDCAWSGLYWYTDLESAKGEARRTHRPILALRMLGNLDEELSCANSRFFRTILYSDRAISAYMKANFVLEWESVRPVPKVTIEFGDGRVMHRTITGNSIHYLLDANGTPIDALPGLYAPKAFLAQLQAWRKPNARTAAPLAYSKMITEAPMLTKIDFGAGDGADFDANTLALIREKHGDADLDAVVARLRDSLAADTKRNEEELRPKIRALLTKKTWTVKELNEAVYANVFLTPLDDPWMGLMPEPVFTAIGGEGLQSR
jgi:hypothetical protein